MAKTGFVAGLQLAEEKGAAPIMDQEFTVTKDMMRKRPIMAEDGIKVGDTLKGKVLWAKYSNYMRKFSESGDQELLDALLE